MPRGLEYELFGIYGGLYRLLVPETAFPFWRCPAEGRRGRARLGGKFGIARGGYRDGTNGVCFSVCIWAPRLPESRRAGVVCTRGISSTLTLLLEGDEDDCGLRDRSAEDLADEDGGVTGLGLTTCRPLAIGVAIVGVVTAGGGFADIFILSGVCL